MVDTDLRRNHRSSARPAADSIACRIGDWRAVGKFVVATHIWLPLADAFSPGHVQSVVHEIKITPVDPYTRTGGCHANHAHAADRSDHRGITRYWPRNRAEAR